VCLWHGVAAGSHAIDGPAMLRPGDDREQWAKATV
jgi:hypothetical protein